MSWLAVRYVESADGRLGFAAGEVIKDDELAPAEIDELVGRGLVVPYQCRRSDPWQCFDAKPGQPLAPHCEARFVRGGKGVTWH